MRYTTRRNVWRTQTAKNYANRLTSNFAATPTASQFTNSSPQDSRLDPRRACKILSATSRCEHSSKILQSVALRFCRSKSSLSRWCKIPSGLFSLYVLVLPRFCLADGRHCLLFPYPCPGLCELLFRVAFFELEQPNHQPTFDRRPDAGNGVHIH